jgi:hypothetical protein
VARREARPNRDPADVERLMAELERLEHGHTNAHSQVRSAPEAESIEQRLASFNGFVTAATSRPRSTRRNDNASSTRSRRWGGTHVGDPGRDVPMARRSPVYVIRS